MNWETRLRVSDALLGAALLVWAECLVVVGGAHGELAGDWEIRDALVRLAPIAWFVLLPATLLGALVLVAPRRLTATTAGVLGAVLGVSVSGGRHFAALPLRAAFVAVLSAAAGAVGFALAGPLLRGARSRPLMSAVAASGAALVLELANRWVLPRLYPGFHLGLTVVTCMLAPFIALGVRPPQVSRRETTVRLGALLSLAAFVAACSIPWAKRLTLNDNLRWFFMGRAPLMSIGIEAVARLAPPPPLEVVALASLSHDASRHVDWRDRDIVLISIDALRADHVGAYGYGRATTPNIDALAREGIMFLHAYCPTPHTSYSVTSMMTGKHLRPLLLLGLGGDSDTWAGLLRTYGYKTAAFYPPAVFFIDGDKFADFRDRKLDFEYARVEFAEPTERARAVEAYLARREPGQRVFLWVHLFEPHEPYVAHPEHAFGDRDIDRYDSEVAHADAGVGEIVRAVRARRPGAVVIVTADHGEEFGDHDGRYHGTTVYEEQVRVPLVIGAAGLAGPRRVDAPVQTIDLLPTVLAALDIPRPARVRGNDLGHWIAGPLPVAQEASAPAFAETDDQTLLAEGSWRLVCARRAAACALFDLAVDEAERHDVAPANAARFGAMKQRLRRLTESHGQLESAGLDAEGGGWPSAIRRAMAGDADAATEVAGLLDDSNVAFRRKAAEVLFELRRKETAPALRLALARDDDAVVRRWCALGLARTGDLAPATDLVDSLDLPVRRLAALAFAENGDARGGATLVAWWQTDPPSFVRARELIAALASIRAKEAVPALLHSLDDVRLRPYVANALGVIGHSSARAPLAERWASERYVNARIAMGEALVRLGAKRELVAPLVRFLGTPDPLPNGLELAARAGILADIGGPADAALGELRAGTAQGVTVRLAVPGGAATSARVLVRAETKDGHPGTVRLGRLGDALVTLAVPEGPPIQRFGALPGRTGSPVEITVQATPNVVIDALAVVPLSDELPPPPPEPWKPDATQPD